MAKLDSLEAKVREVQGTAASGVTLIQGLAQLVREAGTDETKLAALVADLDAAGDSLAEAIGANPLPAGEETPPGGDAPV